MCSPLPQREKKTPPTHRKLVCQGEDIAQNLLPCLLAFSVQGILQGRAGLQKNIYIWFCLGCLHPRAKTYEGEEPNFTIIIIVLSPPVCLPCNLFVNLLSSSWILCSEGRERKAREIKDAWPFERWRTRFEDERFAVPAFHHPCKKANMKSAERGRGKKKEW